MLRSILTRPSSQFETVIITCLLQNEGRRQLIASFLVPSRSCCTLPGCVLSFLACCLPVYHLCLLLALFPSRFSSSMVFKILLCLMIQLKYFVSLILISLRISHCLEAVLEAAHLFLLFSMLVDLIFCRATFLLYRSFSATSCLETIYSKTIQMQRTGRLAYIIYIYINFLKSPNLAVAPSGRTSCRNKHSTRLVEKRFPPKRET